VARADAQELIMTSSRATTFLRRVLFVDAASCAVMGALLLFAAQLLADALALPAVLLREAGVVLLPFAAFVAWIATRTTMSRAAVWTVIALNALWVIESVALLMTGRVAPNFMGYAFVLMQAAIVAVLAELEYMGLRRSAVTA
jgi:hypothetical protein